MNYHLLDLFHRLLEQGTGSPQLDDFEGAETCSVAPQHVFCEVVQVVEAPQLFEGCCPQLFEGCCPQLPDGCCPQLPDGPQLFDGCCPQSLILPGRVTTGWIILDGF